MTYNFKQIHIRRTRYSKTHIFSASSTSYRYQSCACVDDRSVYRSWREKTRYE